MTFERRDMYQVMGGERWTGDEKFDVQGKMDEVERYTSREAGEKVVEAAERPTVN